MTDQTQAPAQQQSEWVKLRDEFETFLKHELTNVATAAKKSSAFTSAAEQKITDAIVNNHTIQRVLGWVAEKVVSAGIASAGGVTGLAADAISAGVHAAVTGAENALASGEIVPDNTERLNN